MGGGGGKKSYNFNMFPHVNFLRYFFWGTRPYVDTSRAKINSVAIQVVPG